MAEVDHVANSGGHAGNGNGDEVLDFSGAAHDEALNIVALDRLDDEYVQPSVEAHDGKLPADAGAREEEDVGAVDSFPVGPTSGLKSLSFTQRRLCDDHRRSGLVGNDLARKSRIDLKKHATERHKAKPFTQSGYQVTRTLRQCPHGAVKLARKPCSDKQRPQDAISAADFVAVKVFPRFVLQNGRLQKHCAPSSRESYRAAMRRVDAVRTLEHPNIERELDTFEDACFIYEVMELYTGGDILAREESKLPESRVAWIIQQILSAVSRAHSVGMLHQDLRPENVVYATKDSESRVVVTNWSCFEHVDTPPKSSRNDLFYSPFSAPELRPETRSDRGDIWSVGMMTYGLLTMSLPYGQLEPQPSGASLRDFVWSSEGEDFGVSCRDFISSLLRVDPASRPSADEALRHPWMVLARRAQMPAPGPQPFKQDMQAMFRKSSMLAEVAALIASERFSGQQFNDLMQCFMACDSAGDGTVACLDVVRILGDFLKGREAEEGPIAGREVPVPEEVDARLEEELYEVLAHPAKVAAMVSGMATTLNGRIAYKEILDLMAQHCMQNSIGLCWEAFRRFDAEGDGQVAEQHVGQIVEAPEIYDVLQRSHVFLGDRLRSKEDVSFALEELRRPIRHYSRLPPQIDKTVSFEQFLSSVFAQ